MDDLGAREQALSLLETARYSLQKALDELYKSTAHRRTPEHERVLELLHGQLRALSVAETKIDGWDQL